MKNDVIVRSGTYVVGHYCPVLPSSFETYPPPTQKMKLIALSFLGFIGLSLAPVNAQITARGSDSTPHVVKALAEAFEKETGKSVKIEGGGSGAGAKAAIAGEVQLAFLSRELNAGEKSGGLVAVEYAIDGVAIIVNKANPATDISLADLKALYSGATETLNDKPVVLFNRNPDSGTREVFQEIVLGKETKFSDKAAIKHDGIIVSSVAKIPTALAYTSLAEADDTVAVLKVKGIKPTPETLRNKSYPITRTPTLATKGAPTGDVKDFIAFAVGPKGQAIVEEQKLTKTK